MEYRLKLEPFTPVLHTNTGNVVSDVLIVDDHPLMCEALSMTFTAAFGLKRVRTASSLAAAEASIRADGAPHAVVLDLNLPDVEGIEGVVCLRSRALGAYLSVLSAEVDPNMIASVLAAGACGYIEKSLPRGEMLDAFRRMWNGEIIVPEGYEEGDGNSEEAALAQTFSTLTPQQMNILRLICQGRPNKIISYELSIAEATVKTHIAAIMSKINVRNRTQAALLASRARLFVR
ncbi:response regulator transcription factor [Paracoccus caeni]|uniref:Response regulator transcription factor n=1 Tax=Paracoccus caeni TaxID=657651 RepID=A0A934SN11_9RHOB|nr:response regulator transcription factor [Paracoccus caeni]MBK4218212.1 response regulator transcription factor [Paracoccus caeni]